MKPSTILLTISIFFILTISDIIMVENVYRPLNGWSLINVWHFVFFGFMMLLTFLLVASERNIIPLSIPIAMFTGIEDTLYYIILGRIPEIYKGISVLGIWEPSKLVVLRINLLGLLLISGIVLLYQKLIK